METIAATPTTLEILVTLSALAGAILGVVNFVDQRRLRRVALKVVPKASRFAGRWPDGREHRISKATEFRFAPVADQLVIEVINLSTFPVVLADVGLVLRGTKSRLALIPELHSHETWPLELPPRHSATLGFGMQYLLASPKLALAQRAYVSTACGTTRTGTSGALRSLLSQVAVGSADALDGT